VLLTTDRAQYLDTLDWVATFGTVRRIEREEYGRATSIRAVYDDDLDVEFALAPADWASAPVDAGTEQVARDGIVVLLDRDGDATALAAAVRSSRSRPQLAAPRAAVSRDDIALPDVDEAHRACSKHRDALATAERCGCFHCCAEFDPAAITEWVDAGTTALCPRCGIDAVIPLRPGMDEAFLRRMKARWF